jgi:hypothetical protein
MHDLIDKIGFAESVQQIEHNVTQTIKKVKNVFENESGVTASFDTEDIKSYVSQVIEELESRKKR